MKYLSPSEREHYENRLAGLEEQQKKTLNSSIQAIRSIGTKDVEKEIFRIKRLIEEGTPKAIRSNTKNKLNREYNELLEKIKEGMPTYDEMWQTRNGVVFGENVRKHREWERRNGKRIERLREIARMLDMHDVSLGSIERLRKTSGTTNVKTGEIERTEGILFG